MPINDVEKKKNAFKAYDIRGSVPDELDEELAYRIGRIYPELFDADKVAVGRDIRLTSKMLCDALVHGLTDAGCDVVDIGLCGTEMIYFATAHLELDGGIMVTASHNPKDYNGMKLVRKEARPISADTGLRDLEKHVLSEDISDATDSEIKGSVTAHDILPDYIAHLLTYINTQALKPLKVVVNAGNGGAGPIIDALEKHLPFRFIKINHEPDGNFPNGIPNPLLEENRASTIAAVKENNADVGIAWDGDFDRCFFFDEKGQFIDGYYLVGFLAQALLKNNPEATIIHDPRLTWNTIELVHERGGVPLVSKSGHAFIKERMREEDALYGGEMSAHHYFKDFSYCDSGMIPWLLILEIMCRTGKPLSEMLAERIQRHPISGEINRKVADPDGVISKIEDAYYATAESIDKTDGLSVEFDTWRFNIRMSNTEPVIRLNVETRGDKALLKSKTEELLQLIDTP